MATTPPRTDGFCSDCGRPLQHYAFNPGGGGGYVSPESDDLPGSIKEVMLEGRKAYEAIPRIICGACYGKAFERKNPGNVWPEQEKIDLVYADLDRASRIGLLAGKPVIIQPPVNAEGITAEVATKAQARDAS